LYFAISAFQGQKRQVGWVAKLKLHVLTKINSWLQESRPK